MTAPDVRTAAQARAETIWRHNQCRTDGNECVECVFRQSAFINGAVWGAAYVTPTREQLSDTLDDALSVFRNTAEIQRLSDHLADAVMALWKKQVGSSTS